MSDPTPSPRVSIIIASKVRGTFLERCLASVREQAQAHDGEVIVVAAGDGFEAIAAEHPWVRVVPGEGITEVPALRRKGVEASTGEYVAVIEEHCSAAPDWLDRALAAHAEGEYAAVGGPILDDDYPQLSDWVTYFIEYNSALPPAPAGETELLNDANIVYRRGVLDAHLDLLDDGYWPMKLHPTLLAEGHKLLSVPEMGVLHLGPWDYRYYLGQRFLFSRAFAGVRARQESPAKRLAYIVGAPLVFLLMLARISSTVFKKQCRVPKFIQSLPLVAGALAVFVAGEWVGCLLGPGDALSKVE